MNEEEAEMRLAAILTLMLGILSASAHADEALKIEMRLAEATGQGKAVGTITAIQTPYGVLLTPVSGELFCV